MDEQVIQPTLTPEPQLTPKPRIPFSRTLLIFGIGIVLIAGIFLSRINKHTKTATQTTPTQAHTTSSQSSPSIAQSMIPTTKQAYLPTPSGPLPLFVYHKSGVFNGQVEDQLILANPNSKTEKILLNFQKAADLGPPDKIILSPNKQKIAFELYTQGITYLYLMDSNGTHLETVFDSKKGYPDAITNFFFTKDSSSLVYFTEDADLTDSTHPPIIQVDLTSNKRTNIPFSTLLSESLPEIQYANALSQRPIPFTSQLRDALLFGSITPFNNGKNALYTTIKGLYTYSLSDKSEKQLFNASGTHISLLGLTDTNTAVVLVNSLKEKEPNKVLLEDVVSGKQTVLVPSSPSFSPVSGAVLGSTVFLISDVQKDSQGFINPRQISMYSLTGEKLYSVQSEDINALVGSLTPEQQTLQLPPLEVINGNETPLTMDQIVVPANWQKETQKDGSIILKSSDYKAVPQAFSVTGAWMQIKMDATSNSLQQGFENVFKQEFDLHPGGAGDEHGRYLTINNNPVFSSIYNFEGYAHTYLIKGRTGLHTVTVGGESEQDYMQEIGNILTQVTRL